MKILGQRSAFATHVITLVGWTAISQGLYICALPILSRLYSVETFGHLAVLQAVSAFVIAVAALRYEVAVLMPSDDETAVNVLAIAFMSIVLVTCASSIAVYFASYFHLLRGQMAFLQDCAWLIPLFVCCAGSTEALTNWSIRKKAYPVIARTKIAQVASQFCVQLGLGLAHFGPVGLYTGDVFGRAGGAGALLKSVWQNDRSLLPHITWKRMLQAAKTYKSFPLYSTWAILLGCSGRNLIPLVLAWSYGPICAGWYAMASRVIAGPLELICRSYSQVYLGEASALAREDPAALMKLYMDATKKLLLIGIAPSIALALSAPLLFPLIFGTQWRGAGVYASLMSILLLAQFVHFALAATLNILSKQHWQLVWDGANLLLGVGGILFLRYCGVSDNGAILYYSCSMATMFVIHFYMCYAAINQQIASFETKRTTTQYMRAT